MAMVHLEWVQKWNEQKSLYCPSKNKFSMPHVWNIHIHAYGSCDAFEKCIFEQHSRYIESMQRTNNEYVSELNPFYHVLFVFWPNFSCFHSECIHQTQNNKQFHVYILFRLCIRYASTILYDFSAAIDWMKEIWL